MIFSWTPFTDGGTRVVGVQPNWLRGVDMQRILIADQLPPNAAQVLTDADFEVIEEPKLNGSSLADALRTHQPTVLIVRSTRVDAGHIEAGAALQLIVRAGAGVNTIDTVAASSRAISVANCPGMNAAAVAELAMGHILNADRRIADSGAASKAGLWQKKALGGARGLKGRRLGVIGCGATGTALIQRAQAFGLRVGCVSRDLTENRARALGVTPFETPEALASESDILSVHVSLTPETRGFIGKSVFERLPDGAIFVNVSRGEVVDESALLDAVRSKGLRAGLDVFQDEPAADGPWSPEWSAVDGIYSTHHIGASTIQAQESVAEEACRVVLRWREDGFAPNCVNLAKRTPATHQLVIRHVDRVGVLASLLDGLKGRGINIQGMENIIYAGAGAAACARIQTVGQLDARLIETLSNLDAVFDITVVELE